MSGISLLLRFFQAMACLAAWVLLIRPGQAKMVHCPSAVRV